MNTNIDRFQKKLEALENGAQMDDCLEGLDAVQAELFQLAASLRTFKPPARKDEAIMAQLDMITKMAEKSLADRPYPTNEAQTVSNSTDFHLALKDRILQRKNWSSTRLIGAVVASAVMLLAVIACVSLVTLGIWWSGIVRTRTAALVDVSGDVMVAPAGDSDDWQLASNGDRIRAGQQLRVGPDSAARLVFYEGSSIVLSSGSQVILDQLSGNWLKTLKMVLVQEAGATRHEVVPLQGSRSFYKVITPSGTASVRGTNFSVALDEDGYARFSVDTGEVLVQVDSNEVILTSGQATVAQSGGLTLDAAYQFSLIGSLTDKTPDSWSVNNVTFRITTETRITGDPQVGTQVLVEGRILNGERIADRILVLTGNQSESSFTGILESKGGEFWGVGGVDVLITAGTQLVGDLQVGKPVKVIFMVSPEGNWVALEIIVLEEPPVEPTPTPTFTELITPTLTAAPTSQTIDLPNCYRITFLGVVDHGDGTSTWRYAVGEMSCAQDLSNWVLELPGCAQIVDASPSPWEAVHPDPNLGLEGIKWEVGVGFESGEFSVTLSGALSTGATRVGAKGPDEAISSIAGPACELGTATPSPTATNTPTATIPPTATLTPMVTITPTVTNTPPASTGPILITDNNQVLTINCNGAAVTVNGNSNTITLLGICSSLTVRGNNNRITLESPTTVTDTGNENVITMPGAPPITPQSTPAAPPPPASLPTQAPPASTGSITITDNNQVLTINCNGAAVTVNGNSNTITLLGSCSSLTVRGNNNQITLQTPTVINDTGNGNITNQK